MHWFKINVLVILGLFLIHIIRSEYTCQITHYSDTNNNFPFWSRGFARNCCDIYPQDIGKQYKKGFFKTIANTEYASLLFESGSKLDKHYFYQIKAIPQYAVIYIMTAELHVFIEQFLKLPLTSRIVLVTGGEDIGVPWEIFHPNRSHFNHISLQLSRHSLDLVTFLQDSRLVTWYTQNYDLIGCNLFTCSTIGTSTNNNRISKDINNIINKVMPIPIGLDFHTIAEKTASKIPPSQSIQNASICQQIHEVSIYHDKYTPLQLPYTYRNLIILAQFSCDFKTNDSLRLSRGYLCQLFQQYDNTKNINPDHMNSLHIDNIRNISYHLIHEYTDNTRMIYEIDTIQTALKKRKKEKRRDITTDKYQTNAIKTPTTTTTSSSSSSSGSHNHDAMVVLFEPPHNIKSSRNINARVKFWTNIGHVSFVLAPPGHGMDTHRLWEILHMNTIPIVLTSPLNSLYRQFPIIIVDSWNQIFSKAYLLDAFKKLQQTFGKEPFLNEEVIRKLTMNYWINHIRNTSKSIQNL